jgi:hypothetical protein
MRPMLARLLAADRFEREHRAMAATDRDAREAMRVARAKAQEALAQHRLYPNFSHHVNAPARLEPPGARTTEVPR